MSYISKDSMDIYESLNYENVIDAQQLSEIVEKSIELINSMKILRNIYKSSGKLPLSNYHDDYENMQLISELIEGEFLKFGQPVKIQKTYIEFSKDEIEEIKSNPMDLSISGLDEWVEEGLI